MTANVSQVCLVPDLELQTFKIQITMKKEQNLKEPHKQALNIPVVSGWRSFSDEKPLDGKRYHYSQGNQFFKGVWSDKLQGFLLDGCGGKYISRMCDYFHASH